jgi:hypothetical protein
MTGKQLKLRGMTLAAAKRNADLEWARAHLVKLAMSRPSREVSADDAAGFKLGNAAGSLFKCPEWLFVRFKLSETESRRCGVQRIWRLR